MIRALLITPKRETPYICVVLSEIKAVILQRANFHGVIHVLRWSVKFPIKNLEMISDFNEMFTFANAMHAGLLAVFDYRS
jgi:hypothetical protein